MKFWRLVLVWGAASFPVPGLHTSFGAAEREMRRLVKAYPGWQVDLIEVVK